MTHNRTGVRVWATIPGLPSPTGPTSVPRRNSTPSGIAMTPDSTTTAWVGPGRITGAPGSRSTGWAAAIRASRSSPASAFRAGVSLNSDSASSRSFGGGPGSGPTTVATVAVGSDSSVVPAVCQSSEVARPVSAPARPTTPPGPT
jgi:hypothetical protein